MTASPGVRHVGTSIQVEREDPDMGVGEPTGGLGQRHARDQAVPDYFPVAPARASNRASAPVASHRGPSRMSGAPMGQGVPWREPGGRVRPRGRAPGRSASVLSAESSPGGAEQRIGGAAAVPRRVSDCGPRSATPRRVLERFLDRPAVEALPLGHGAAATDCTTLRPCRSATNCRRDRARLSARPL